MTTHSPIFLDRKGRRTRITNAVIGIAGAVAMAGICIVSIGVMFAPELPRLKSVQQAQQDHPTQITPRRTEPIAPWRPKSGFESQPILRLAYASPNDLGSIASLQLHAGKLDAIVLDCLELNKAPSGIGLTFVKECNPHFDWLADSAPQVKVYPMLSEIGLGAPIAATLAVERRRAALIEDIASFLQERKAAGIVIDTTSIPELSYRNLIVFLNELRAKLAADNRSLILMADLGTDAIQLQQLARIADYIIAKTYDQPVDKRPAGPIAAQGWFDSRVAEISSKIDRSKLIIGIGAFGYEWKHGIQKRVSIQYAWDKVALFGGQIRFDPRSLNPTFQYTEDGIYHEIWYLDAITGFNQMRSALSVKPAGVAIWRIGLEDPGVWTYIQRERFPDDEAIKLLAQMEAGAGAFAKVQGPLLTIGSEQTGRRELVHNQGSGLITDETLQAIPRRTNIVPLHNKDSKNIALTFDDGPSAEYTERILDILKAKGVKATFYILGLNAIRYPNIVRRIYAEGHDIGNHSFSHPNFFIASETRVIAELNATQRILESSVGVRTILLRPPYTDANYWRLDEAPILVQVISSLGYVIGGWDADFTDYIPFGSIPQRAINAVEAGGRSLLLHDAGGKREPTIEALPLIIDGLRARGYNFVTTGELVGIPRDTMMPPVRGVANGVEVNARGASLNFVSSVSGALPIIGISTAILGTIRVILVAIGAFIHRRRERLQPKRDRVTTDRITVLVPAYNEEKVICKTVDTLLASTIADRLEILVIDDGSSDRTTAIVQETYGAYPNVKVHRKPNGGKASALNVGIQLAETDIIVAIDGDTMLLPDAIELLTDRLLDDPKIGAVAGSVLVGNATTFITRCQALEYITSQNMDRRAFELINAIGVVPGCIGAWRKQALIDAGGYSTNTLAEDADLTITIERQGWKVVSECRAIALTEAPETLRAFMKQRLRWTFGMLQVACKHAGVLCKPQGMTLTVFNVFFFQIALALFSPLFDGMLVYSIFWLLIGFDSDSLIKLIVYWFIFQSIDVAATAVGLWINGEKAPWRLLPLLLLQRFSYRQLLYVVTIRAILAAVKGRFIGWGKLIRTGTVKLRNRGAT